ncbi:MAG: hypothetical protein ACRCT8_16165 [Lacipirellulaceae bacterium]
MIDFMAIVPIGLPALVGCGGSGAYDVTAASGTVRYADGSLIPAGRIELRFLSQQPPIDAKTYPRQGLAEVNVSDGSFKVTTYAAGDGLIAGEHRVIAVSIAPGGGCTTAIPKEYASAETTPLVVRAEESPLEILIDRK